MEDVCSIKVTDDGKFVVQVMPPRKKEKEVKAGMAAPATMEEPKTYVADDEEALAELITKYVAGRGKKKTSADKFAKGFTSKD